MASYGLRPGNSEMCGKLGHAAAKRAGLDTVNAPQ
jgi:hypothetical protein